VVALEAATLATSRSVAGSGSKRIQKIDIEKSNDDPVFRVRWGVSPVQALGTLAAQGRRVSQSRRHQSAIVSRVAGVTIRACSRLGPVRQ
jgi:hypothetical protein